MKSNSIKFDSVADIIIRGGLIKYKSSLYFLMSTLSLLLIYLRNENNNYIL